MEKQEPALWSVPAPLAENPYQTLLYEALAHHGWALLNPTPSSPFAGLWRHRGRGRILHIHWIWLKNGRIARPLRFLRARALLLWARLLGWKIVCTVHNLSPHDGKRLDRLLHNQILRAADGLIAHGHQSAETLRRDLSKTQVAVIPHGNYLSCYPRLASNPHRESRPTTFLFLGQLHPYKGIDDLIESFAASDLDARLIVAGQARNPRFAQRLRELAGDDPRIELELRFIPDSELPTLAARADWAALPFRKVTTSGSLIMALGLGLPAIIPRCPDLMEAAGDAALIREPKETIEAALRRALLEDPTRWRERAIARSEELSWGPIAARTAEFLSEL